jgi:hypothetical protein
VGRGLISCEKASERAVAGGIFGTNPTSEQMGQKGPRKGPGVPVYGALVVLIVGIALALFVVLFFGAVLMLLGGA